MPPLGCPGPVEAQAALPGARHRSLRCSHSAARRDAGAQARAPRRLCRRRGPIKQPPPLSLPLPLLLLPLLPRQLLRLLQLLLLLLLPCLAVLAVSAVPGVPGVPAVLAVPTAPAVPVLFLILAIRCRYQ